MGNRYLPIGSVIKLKNKDKTLMITGYYSVEYDKDLEIYDYSGCAYPEGMMIKSSYCSFNQNDIETILFEGFKTDEYTKLTNGLNDLDNDIIEENSKYLDDVKGEKGKVTMDKADDFVIPHYEFDVDGIIIE